MSSFKRALRKAEQSLDQVTLTLVPFSGGPVCPCEAAVRPELFRLRREVPHGVRRQEEGHGDPQPGDGDQRVPRHLQDPQAEEGEQVQDDGR